MDHTFYMIGWILLGIAIFAALVFLVKTLWNWLLPNILNVKKITFIQAFGLLVLAKILFGGLGCGIGNHHWKKGCYGAGDGEKCEYRKECKMDVDKN